MSTVLLVDDHPPNLIALEGVLAPLNLKTVTAASGEEALRLLLHQTDVALILLDVQMPGLDGFQTAALLKQVERTRSIPVIFVSALSRDSEAVSRGYREGAVDYVLKPFEPEALKAKVSLFVEFHRQALALKQAHARDRTVGQHVQALHSALSVAADSASELGKLISQELGGERVERVRALEKSLEQARRAVDHLMVPAPRN